MCTAAWTKVACLMAALTAGVPTLWAMATPTTGSITVAMCWQPESEETPPPTDDTAGPPPEADAPRPHAKPEADKDAVPASPPAPQPAPPVNPADQREARIVTSNGTVFTGLLVEHGNDRIVLKIGGIPTPFPAKDITKIETLLPNRDRYEQYRSALDPKDVRGRLSLSQWLVSVDMFNEALVHLDEVLKIDPDEKRAIDLKTVVEGLIQLRKNRDRPSNPSIATRPATQTRTKASPFPVLSADDINMIRVYEVNLADPPRMSVARSVVTRLLEEHAGDPLIPVSREGRDAIYRRRADEILALMFKLRARDLYGEIKVQQDPASMRLFRDQVHRGWLLNYCATTDCHGGAEAGSFWLNTKGPNTDATVYTNFYIMEKTRIRATRGDRRDEMVPLIDYANPAQSPLLQLALPPENSLYPHPTPNRPGKAPFKPLFRDENDSRFRKTVEWMGTMFLPRPDYRIDYVPPKPPAPEVAPQSRDSDPQEGEQAPSLAPHPPSGER
jgi:hypothetical protein